MDGTRVAPGLARTVEIPVRQQANTAIQPWAFIALALQLGLVLGVAWIYRVELERGFGIVSLLILFGFAIHSWLPARFRLPFFLLLTSTAVAVLLKTDGFWLVGLGLALIGLCHMPVAWWLRVTLVCSLAAVLALLQTGWLEVPWAAAVLPVLGAIFMFRLILYLYDLKDENTPASPWQRLAYFFLLPNICFPLFPVIDFKSFVRGYYDAPAAEIYQKGVYWILQGLSHILVYRIVYHLLPIADLILPIADQASLFGVFVFMAMTYGLYLRVSGLFHLIVGILCLFGFNLPRTNNHYFLASSFTDLWRRINIYWKDFMMTVVFYPVFLGVRRWGVVHRIVLATACVFLVTWFLHSYQWFWLQGVFPITGRDVAFWGILGVALAINSVREARHGKERRVTGSDWSVREALSRTGRTFGVFSVMAILWSLWNSESLLEWYYRVLRIQESTHGDVALFTGLVVLVFGLGVGSHWLEAHDLGLSRIESLAWKRAPAYVPSVAIGLLLLAHPTIHEQFGRRATFVVARAQSTALNSLDFSRQERGYYEALSRSTQLGPNVPAMDENFISFRASPAARMTSDLRGYELVPNVRINFKGSEFRTNRWGLHDREYPREKSASTYRIALLGSSIVMGWGVERNSTFENLLEDRLNRDLAGELHQRFEILNFSVGGYNVLQALYVAEHQLASFSPDAIVYVIHNNEMSTLAERLQLSLKLGVEPSELYPPVRQALEVTGSHAYLPDSEFKRRLRPYREEILGWVYRRMVEEAKSQEAVPVFVLLRVPARDFTPDQARLLTQMVRAAGGVVIYPEGLFEGYELSKIELSAGDAHPNAFGHALIADALYDAFLRDGESLGIVAP